MCIRDRFMVGMAEVEVDKETGKVDLIDYAAVVDCGTVVNPNLARIQTCLLYTSCCIRWQMNFIRCWNKKDRA